MTPEEIVLFAVKSHYAEAILDGSKPIEYRRVPPAAEPPYEALLYASGGPGKIVGGATIVNETSLNVPSLIDETIDEVPHSRFDLEAYFDGSDIGTALRIGGVERFDPAIPIDFVYTVDPDFSIPQNFRYLDVDVFEQAREKFNEHVESGGIVHQGRSR